MKIEHFALNVAEPVKMAAWYVQHLGMIVMRGMDEEPFAHFLADSNRDVMIEIYNNPATQVPDYEGMNPLLLHLAFVAEEPEVEKKRLEAAGARTVDEIRVADGSHIVMMRDPWGLAIQLCKRGEKML